MSSPINNNNSTFADYLGQYVEDSNASLDELSEAVAAIATQSISTHVSAAEAELKQISASFRASFSAYNEPLYDVWADVAEATKRVSVMTYESSSSEPYLQSTLASSSHEDESISSTSSDETPILASTTGESEAEEVIYPDGDRKL